MILCFPFSPDEDGTKALRADETAANWHTTSMVTHLY